jgi:branched-chain amino acid transport system substrate-binding protein
MITSEAGRARHRMRILGAITTLALACLGAGAAATRASAAAKSTAVQIGAVVPLSGSSAAAGVAIEHGAQLALQQANSAKLVPGVTFSLTAASDVSGAGTPAGTAGATGIKTLIADGQVPGIIAPFDTPTALGELPLANRAPVAAVSASATDSCLTVTGAFGCTGNAAELPTVQPTGRTTFFRVVPADGLQGNALADYLSKSGLYHTAYVVDDASQTGAAASITFADEWKVQGGVPLGHASVAPTASYVNLLTQIAALKPDVIVYTGQSEAEGIALRQQMRQIAGLSNEPFAATSALHTTAFAQTIGLNGGATWVVAPEPVISQLPSAATFAAQYQTKFGTPSTDAARGYDSAEALVLAIKATVAGGAKPPTSAGSSAAAFRAAVIAALARTAFTGADGPIAFTAGGDLQQGSVQVDRLSVSAGKPSWTPGGVILVAAPTAVVTTLTPGALDFGRVATQATSQLSLQLTNTGLVPAAVGSVTVGGAGFQLAGTTCTTANLQPSAQCTVTVRFAPTAAATVSGTLTVKSISGATLQTATLRGTGVTPIVLPAAVYVGNGGNSSVRSFTLPLRANQPPATIVAGADTQLDGTAAVALDAFGDLYVINAGNESVTTYRGDATGDAKPMSTLSGPDTGLANPSAIALDRSGRLYVANAAANTVTVYASGAGGDASPIRTISGLFGPSGLVIDSAGNLWVADSPGNNLERFGPNDTKPAATISGSDTQLSGPQSLALDGAGNVLVADEYSSAVTAYSPSASGDVAPAYSIGGPATGLDFPVGLDVDTAGNLYVSNVFANTLTVYSATARANTAPTATLSGSGLAAPEHLAVTPPLAVNTRSLPRARAHRRYRTRLVATFGIRPYHWNIQRGRLPRGVRLDSATGVLAGRPRRPGRFRVHVQVADGLHPADIAGRTLTLIVGKR